jgi:myo-inositol-1(or 4)-monophosphatase
MRSRVRRAAHFSKTTTFALEVAREASDLVMRALAQPRVSKDIRLKGPTDLVTAADRDSERLIAARIRARFPHHALLAEEGTTEAGTAGDGAPARWLIDPLDGTSNFAHGVPWFAISIALEQGGVVQCGVVAIPPLGEFFVGERGRGAYLIAGSDAPVRLAVSGIGDLQAALVATGLPSGPAARAGHIDTIPRMMRRAQEVRIMGAAAAHLACVAAGRLEAFWEPSLNPWDIAAGIVLVEEAGGRVSDLSGRPLRAPRGDLLASNGVLHDPLLEGIGGHGAR